MREAMYKAEVGDDVWGDDPTVKQLEAVVAELLGKEAAMFVPSGTMGNQVAVKVHTVPGDEVILEAGSHVFNYESGAASALSGVQLRTLTGHRGILSADQVVAAIRQGYDWETPSRLVCLENTHNKAGGVVYPLKQLQAVCETARANGLACHLDGARLWNASAASGIAEATYAAGFDTVNVCLSKGLGAPVGSVLAGPAPLMKKARRFRRMMGGGMRQAGILAAAGLYALEHHRDQLSLDHQKARFLAEGLARYTGVSIDPAEVETNIVMFDVVDEKASVALERMALEGVLMVPFGPKTIRATTHRDVTHDDINKTLGILGTLFG